MCLCEILDLLKSSWRERAVRRRDVRYLHETCAQLRRDYESSCRSNDQLRADNEDAKQALRQVLVQNDFLTEELSVKSRALSHVSTALTLVEADMNGIQDSCVFHALRCQICEEVIEETHVLWPCRHAGLCLTCARKVDFCPFCKSHVQSRQKIFFP